MLTLRGLQRIITVLSPHGRTGLRSLSAEVQQTHELIQIKNPYIEPSQGCILCNIKVDFKNIQLLSQFISPHTGRIYGRHITGLCGRKQKDISKAIKKAQAMGFMSVTHKHPQFMKDPNICGSKHLDQNQQ